MLILQDLSYIHADKELLFKEINLTVNDQEKIALIGPNGTGKSTLLKIIAGELQPATGQLILDSTPYFIPQIFGQYNHLSIAQALRIEGKLNAFKEILNGNTSEENFSILNEDWTIEERCAKALSYWQLSELKLSQKMETLSGGQKTKVFLAGISIHQPGLILLDEPTNHLDMTSRQFLYNFIQTVKSTLLIVSHDRKLLNQIDKIIELSEFGIKVYGGNYGFYSEQKQIERNALNQAIQNKEKALRKAKEIQRDTIERKQKLDAKAKKNLKNAGLPKMVSNTWKNSAERSTAKIAGIHIKKIDGISQDLQKLRSSFPDTDKMKFDLDNSTLHKGKILFKAINLNFGYTKLLWRDPLNFQIASGERLALKGRNGSGKTTLIYLILGKLIPETGTIHRVESDSVYIDQDYSLLDDKLNIYEQAQQFNDAALQEHEIKIRLNRFLFSKEEWEKSCAVLSGGERMRLLLCCLMIYGKAPDMIVLDEPTNNLDIQNIQILTTAINEYKGTLIVVSHDETFLKEININREIQL